MKKTSAILVTGLLLAVVINLCPMTVSASTANTAAKNKTKIALKVKSKTKVKAKAKIKTTLKWDASALKIINNFAGFDYSSTVRNAYIKKVENYARRNNIKVVTATVINSMRE